MRTAEHASLEWIYALREVQKAEKKEILHLRNEVLCKKIPQAPRMRQNKEAQSDNRVLHDSLMNYIFKK